MKSSYPVQVKVYLKAVPAMVMTLAVMAVIPTLMFHIQYYRMEGVIKPAAKQTPYEQMLSMRDEKYRHIFNHYFTRQPKDFLDVKMHND